MNYQNFDLEIIASRGSKQLSARVLESPQGDTPFIEVDWPFTLEEETGFLDDIYGGLRQRRARSTKLTGVQDFGGRLFDAVFKGDIEHLFRSSLEASFRTGKGLRIRLRLPDESELHSRPWEFLFDTECQEFLAVREHTPLVRYLPVAQPIPPITVDGPLRILVALASPSDHPRLDVSREWEILYNALESTVLSGQVELRRVPGHCTFDNLRDSLRHFGAHIFHFVGHGVPGALVLEQESGKGCEMEATELRSAFPSGMLPRLVVLNSCSGAIGEDVPFSGLAQGFLRQGVPAVVAMQASITDDAALIFTRYFYRDLIATGAVDTSLTEARLRMKANGHPLEWGTPVLYMRALSGQLFQPAGRIEERKFPASEVPARENVTARAESGLTERKRARETHPRETLVPPKPESIVTERKKPRETQKRETPAPHAHPNPSTVERKKTKEAIPREPAEQPKTEPRVEPTLQLKPEPTPEIKPEPMLVIKPEPTLKIKPEPMLEIKPEPEPKPEPMLEVKPEPTLELRPEPTLQVKPETKSVPKPKPKPEPKLDVKPEPKPQPKPEQKLEPKSAPKPEIEPEPKPEPKLDEPALASHATAKETSTSFRPEPKRGEQTVPLTVEARKPSPQMKGHGFLEQRLYRGWPLAGLLLVFVLTVIIVTRLLSNPENPALSGREATVVTSPAPAPAPSPDVTAKLPTPPEPVPVPAPLPAPASTETVASPVLSPRTGADAGLAQETPPNPSKAANVDDAKPAGAAKRKALPQQQASRKQPAPAASGNCKNPNVSERSVECLFSK